MHLLLLLLLLWLTTYIFLTILNSQAKSWYFYNFSLCSPLVKPPWSKIWQVALSIFTTIRSRLFIRRDSLDVKVYFLFYFLLCNETICLLGWTQLVCTVPTFFCPFFCIHFEPICCIWLTVSFFFNTKQHLLYSVFSTFFFFVLLIFLLVFYFSLFGFFFSFTAPSVFPSFY